MSTVSGIASRGEKGKSKYQSLDINTLYKGESLESNQQKSTVQRCKYGMQSLGKVPSARRPPANLPSLKSENSGSEPAVSLVPAGGAGWGNKPGENQFPTPTQPNVTASSNSVQTSTTHPVQAAPSSAVLSTETPALPSAHEQTAVSTAHTTTSDKSWSSIMAGEAGGHPPSFLAHQSPLFQQEFPKLSSGDGQSAAPGQKGGTDTQYGPGPSLRPQTEGSWIQGGGRPQTATITGTSGSQAASLVQGPLPHHQSGVEAAGGRNNLGPHPPPGVAMDPAGPGLGLPTNGPPMHGPLLHMPLGTSPQFRTMSTPFMYRGNFQPGAFPPNFQAGIGPPRQRFPGHYLSEGRFVGRPVDGEEIVTRPIIKEEELNHMDDIARDSSWARPEEIDYNEKIVFSDTEDSTQDDEKQTRRDDKLDREAKEVRESFENDKDRNRDDKDHVRDRDRDRRPDERSDKRTTDSGSRSRQTPNYTRLNYTPPLRPQTSVQRVREKEEKMWREKQRQQSEMVAVVTERAKQREEEEDKRYEESKRRLGKSQSSDPKDREDGALTVVPLPNWADKNRQIDSDRDRSRTSSEGMDDKLRQPSQSAVSNLRSDRDGRSRPSVGSDDRVKRDFDDKDGSKMPVGHRQDRSRPDDRERPARSSDGWFQNNVPPRFLRQHATGRSQSNYMRSTGSPQPPGSGGGFDPHWSHSSNSFITQSSAPANTGNRMQPRRFNSESSESNTEKSRNDREAEDWEYDRGKSSRERNYGKHAVSYYDVDHNRRYGDRSERRDVDPERNSEESWERDNLRDRERERDSAGREKDRERHPDDRKMALSYEEEREWRRTKDRKSEDRESSELDDDREKDVCSKKEDRKDERRLERPQRPDSRDSRASRESRNSRDSVRDEKHDVDHKSSTLSRGFSSTFADYKDEKKKANEKDKKENHSKYVDEYPLSFPNKSRHRFNYQRHIPGPPITREKLEASEKNDTKRNLTQLKRFSDSKRPNEEKEVWEGQTMKERNSNGLWAETPCEHESQNSEMSKSAGDDKNKMAAPEKRESRKVLCELTKQEPQEKTAKNDLKDEKDSKGEKQDEEKEKREKLSKNRGSRGRSETGRGRQGWSVSVFRSSHGSRGDRRRRDSGRMAGRNRFSNREWNLVSESDGSGDEISASTESGKEDKKPENGRGGKSRSHYKKAEKEEKNKETKKGESGDSKPSLQGSSGSRFDRKGEFVGVSNREGFAPSGQPSRRGRGSVRMRGGISHRMDGYGPPPAKSPFSHSEDKKPGSEKAGEAVSDEKTNAEDEKGKQKQIGGSGAANSSTNRTNSVLGNKGSQIPPRMQKKSDTESRESNRKSSRGSRHTNKSTPDQGDDAWETTSENSDEERKQESRSGRKNYHKRGNYGRGEVPNNSGGGSRSARGGPRSSSASDKKFGNREGQKATGTGATGERNSKNLSSSGSKVEGSISKEETKLSDGNSAQNISTDTQKAGSEEKGSESRSLDFDEGRNKKKEGGKDGSKLERRSGRDKDKERRNKSSKDSANPQQQQLVTATTTSAPQPLMSQVVPALLSTSKNYGRTNLPPRLAKQRQNHRIQKQQNTEAADSSKVNHSMNIFSIKEGGGVGPPSVNAWEKPLLSTSPIKSATLQMAANTSEPIQSDNSSQRSSPHVPREPVDKSLLDGSSPPVNTIIFENTNFKSTPNDIVMKNQFNSHMKQQRLEKGERKINEEPQDILGFSTGKTEMTTSNSNRDIKASEAPIIYGKTEDNADMKLDFQFETELSQLTDDKSTKGMRDLTRSIQQSNMSPSTADLNFKIASVKKVWETMHTVTEHSEDGNVSTFSPNFSPESTMDPSAYGKAVDGSVVVTDDGSEVVYNSVPPMQVNVSYAASKTDVSSTTSNVCKVKPQQQTVLSSGHSPIGHSGQSPLSHGGPISPPPYSSAQGGQFNYQQQTSIGGTAAQFGGMSAIPSPPTVLYNSSTQLPPGYQTFQIDGAQVLSSQAARSQFSQFPPYGLSQGIGQTSAFSQQSLYLHQTAPPTPAPDIYQPSLSPYRLQPAAGPFGQSQVNNNPNTVLISSTANSLMSATVKPSTQPIGAIGTKGAAPYQQNPLPSQHSQLFIPYDPVQLGVNQSYLPNSQIVQRGAPVQPSASSFYSSSAGAQAGFYQTPGSTLTQQGPGAPQLHQAAGYSLQGFNSQSSATPVGLQSFGSQMGAQQYRTPGSVAPTTYLKSAVTHHHHPTALNLAQKTSTTSSQQDVLDSVFSSAPQIPSPKPRPSKQISQQQQQPQQSPTQQPNNKFGSYQSVTQSSAHLQSAGAQRVSQSNINIQNVKSSGNSPRYPTPIQRPISYQHNSNRYRPQQPRPASSVKPYFGSQDGNLKLEESGDLKSEDATQLNCDAKISDAAAHGKTEGPEDDAPKD